jgi:hypothetical protein
MNTFVGFLRLANYVNACCVIFGVILSIFLQDLGPILRISFTAENAYNKFSNFGQIYTQQ